MYDADCGFCRRIPRQVLRVAQRADVVMDPLELQDPAAERLLAPMPREEQMASWHLLSPDGSVTSGGAALPLLLDSLGRFSLIAKVARGFPRATDAAYRFVASHRAGFGRVTRWLPDYRAS
ncbi:MAG: DCC1-like thiol-disulfide oxidoreductase family protein [Solirubrobacterales bacterium]